VHMGQAEEMASEDTEGASATVTTPLLTALPSWLLCTVYIMLLCTPPSVQGRAGVAWHPAWTGAKGGKG